MKFIPLIIKNIRRNLRRTILTIGGLAVSIFLYVTLATSVDALNRIVSSAGSEVVLWTLDRVSARHSASKIPQSYVEQMKTAQGVEVVSPVLFYMASYRTDQDRMMIMAVDPPTFRAVNPFPIDDASYRAFAKDKTAAMVGRVFADEYRLKVGDSITLKGRKNEGLTFILRGIGEEPRTRFRDPHTTFVAHLDYVQELTNQRGIVTNIWLKVDRPASAPRVASEVDAMFANSPNQTKTQSQKGFMLSLVRQMETIKVGIYLIGLAIIIASMVGTANSIAMSTRERTTEVGLLKSLGFLKGHILTLILGESLLVSLAGGVTGVVLSYALLTLMDIQLPVQFGPARGNLVIGFEAIPRALVVSLIVGLVGGAVPAFRASRLRVIEALRDI